MTKRRAFIFAFVLAFLVVFAVHFLDFPGSLPRFKETSGGGVLLDQSPLFTVDAIYERLLDYGEEGRKNYAFRNVTVDILLPLSLLPFLFLLMFHAVRSLQLNRSLRVLLLSFPFVFVIFDFAENADVLVLLNNYPKRIDFMARLLPYVTSVKLLALLLSLFLPVGIFGIRFLRGELKKRPVI
jgi:hypothetical protein